MADGELVGTEELIRRGRAMATDINVRVVLPRQVDPSVLEDAVTAALEVFAEVESACTRFDDQSPLMRANARPTEAHRVPWRCLEALREAARFYDATHGRFDPRILTDLVALGYDRSLRFACGSVEVHGSAPGSRRALHHWHPRFAQEVPEVVLGRLPVDLGGIGKGLAVRWASQMLRRSAPDHLVEAGGDCFCAGSAPAGGPWLLGVEDPFGGATPRAVLALRDLACATSSTRLRNWKLGGRRVHHLVDPRSGRPGGEGLRAVTVVMPDPAEAEVWSKVLFLAGAGDVASLAEQRTIAALWIDDCGQVSLSSEMSRFVHWGPT